MYQAKYEKAVVRCRLKYLKKILQKYARGEWLNENESKFFHKYCEVQKT